MIDQVDLSAMEAAYGDEQRGQPPYHPRMMTKGLVYGYCVGVFSSRRLVEDVASRGLAAGNQPDFRTISDIRKIHLRTLKALFEQVLRIALEAGAMKVGRVALDGTKVRANESKRQAMSYGRMEEKAIRREMKELLSRAGATDNEADSRYGKGRWGDELGGAGTTRDEIEEDPGSQAGFGAKGPGEGGGQGRR